MHRLSPERLGVHIPDRITAEMSLRIILLLRILRRLRRGRVVVAHLLESSSRTAGSSMTLARRRSTCMVKYTWNPTPGNGDRVGMGDWEKDAA